MNKILLAILTIFILSTGTQKVFSQCKSHFKYEINTKIMTILPATAIDFHDGSEGKIISWHWDFGEGNTSTAQNPTFIFFHPIGGSNIKINPYRTITLTITTADNCKSSFSETLNIIDGSWHSGVILKSEFKYVQESIDTIKGLATVKFENRSIGDTLKYYWQFGNGQTSIEKEPKVNFDIKQHENKVCLTVTDASGKTDLFCDAVYVGNNTKPIINPLPCETVFGYSTNYNINSLTPSLALDFYYKAYPEAVEWKWDFGDGNSSDKPNPTHIYVLPLNTTGSGANQPLYRQVCLSVKTADGCIASFCDTIDLYMNTSKVEPEILCQSRFKFSIAPEIISIPEKVVYRFTDASQGNIISWEWLFEDGSTSTDKEPIKSFDRTKATQKVCLTIYSNENCSSTWCETIYLNPVLVDPSGNNTICNYVMKFTSSFPPQVSSCQGYAKAQVYKNGEPVNADFYSWAHGESGQEVKELCPTKSYSVKAKTLDGCIVNGSFIFNSDGTVTSMPINWWIDGSRDNPLIQYVLSDPALTVEFRLCNGTVIKGDSIPLNAINCGSSQSNLILKDASGNIVYSENIAIKSLTSDVPAKLTSAEITVFPNPVSDVLNVLYSGTATNNLIIEIFELSGKSVVMQKVDSIEPGDQLSINVRALKKGIYILKLRNVSSILSVGKFVK